MKCRSIHYIEKNDHKWSFFYIMFTEHIFSYPSTINIASCSIDLNILIIDLKQGLYRLEKYLNIQDCLEMSLKINFALKST